jgi:NarL family two-component system response regulator YdfI
VAWQWIIIRYNNHHEVDLIRVMIVAPGMANRAGLRAFVSDDPDIQVIAEGSSFTELEPAQPDVDVVVWSPAPSLSSETLQEELSQIRMGESAALLLVHHDPKMIEPLFRLRLRAWGVLDPEATQTELTASIHALDEGLAVVNPVWLKQALGYLTTQVSEDQELIEPLTDREIEILQLLAYGLTNKQIAAKLKISAHTVKFHISSIFTKLGTTNRVETVNLGLKRGLIVL